MGHLPSAHLGTKPQKSLEAPWKDLHATFGTVSFHKKTMSYGSVVQFSDVLGDVLRRVVVDSVDVD